MQAAPPPALVAPAPLAFAPPLGVTLAYETRAERVTAKGVQRFAMSHAVRFTRDGAGWRMEARQTGHEADGSPAARAMFDAAMAPMDGVPVTVALGRGGAPGGVIDGAAAWARVLDGRKAARVALDTQRDLPAAVRAAAQAIYDADPAPDPAARDARLAEWASELVAFSAESLPTGGEAAIEAGALAGRARLLRSDGPLRHYAVDLAGGGVERHDEIAVESATGLLVRSISRRTVRMPGVAADTMVFTLERQAGK